MLAGPEVEFLSHVPIFGALPDKALARIGALARRVDLDGASALFNEGEPAKEMMVVLSGELEVRKRGRDGTDTRIATLRRGDVAGEMSLIDIQPRSAAVRALGPASLIVLSAADLATLYREDLESYTILLMNIAREISRRLRLADRLLADILIDVQEVWSDAFEATGNAGRSIT
jgi:CRP/FNR family transcriptional regulator, cyclic AMP receptor protein